MTKTKSIKQHTTTLKWSHISLLIAAAILPIGYAVYGQAIQNLPSDRAEAAELKVTIPQLEADRDNLLEEIATLQLEFNNLSSRSNAN